MPNTIEPRRLSFSFSKGKKTATPSTQSFQTVFLAEHIKIKRKGIYLISIILSALVPVLYFGYCLKKPETLSSPLPFNLFEHCYSKAKPLTVFFWPLLLIINASRLAQIDHKLGGWQWMETQPVAKLSIYFAKFSVLAFLVRKHLEPFCALNSKLKRRPFPFNRLK